MPTLSLTTRPTAASGSAMLATSAYGQACIRSVRLTNGADSGVRLAEPEAPALANMTADHGSSQVLHQGSADHVSRECCGRSSRPLAEGMKPGLRLMAAGD